VPRSARPQQAMSRSTHSQGPGKFSYTNSALLNESGGAQPKRFIGAFQSPTMSVVAAGGKDFSGGPHWAFCPLANPVLVDSSFAVPAVLLTL
jgi:hypothetical protein